MKKQQLLWSFLIPFFYLSSCSKDFKTPDLSEKKTVRRSAGDGLYDLAGFGYDVTKEYAASNSSTYKVINIEKLKLQEPSRVVVGFASSIQNKLTVGSDAESFAERLSLNVDVTAGAKLFGATIGAKFGLTSYDTSYLSSKWVYGMVSLIAEQKQVKFDAPLSLLQTDYLDPVFASEATTLSAEALVAKYGTHVLRSIKLGGVLDVLYQAQTKSEFRTSASSWGAALNVKGIFNTLDVSAQINSTHNSSDASQNYNQTLVYQTRGGDASKGLLGEVSLDGTTPGTIDIGNWQSGVSNENSELIGFGENGLIPISDLIADPAKKLAVEQYIAAYLQNKTVRTTISKQPVYSYWTSVNTAHYFSFDVGSFITGGYNREVIRFYALDAPYKDSAQAIYSYWSPVTKSHYFSFDVGPTISGGFNREIIRFYAFPFQYPGTEPVYSYWSSATNSHYFSFDVGPTISGGFNREIVRFYAFRYL